MLWKSIWNEDALFSRLENFGLLFDRKIDALNIWSLDYSISFSGYKGIAYIFSGRQSSEIVLAYD